MSKPQRGMPRSLLRRTPPENGEATEGQAEVEAQGRGATAAEQGDDGGPTRSRQARGRPPKKENALRDIKVVNVPRDVCKLLDLESIETERTQSEVVIELLRRHLPNRYVSTRSDQAKGADPAKEQAAAERPTGETSDEEFLR